MTQFKLNPVDYNKPYEEQTDCKRHVIGAYANLARHHMTVTINVIMDAIGMELFNENNIEDAFNKSHRKKIGELDNIQKVNLQKRLYRHFPFFKRMKLEGERGDENKKSVQLNTLLEVMSDFTRCMAMLRNFYTHYHPYNAPEEEEKQLELKKEMGQRLQYLYENTCQMFKSNESLDQESNEVLSALRLPEKYEMVIKPNDKDYKKTCNFYFDPKTSEKKKRGIKYDPYTKEFKKQAIRYVSNPNYQAYMKDEKKGMSDTAIIFFLCLFLEKKDAFDLMDEVGFTKQIKFKGEHADRQMLYLKEIMCMNRIRMTKTRLDSEMSDTALALDMINELRKCPKPLYEVLDKKARDEFKDGTTVIWEHEQGQEAVPVEETMGEEDEHGDREENTPRSTFVRWEDRFPQMALKYIDMKAMFDDIRFQLNLGKYRFAFIKHEKEHSVDGQERLRILQKEVHGFGRVQEVEPMTKDLWRELLEEKRKEDGLMRKEPDVAGQKPYVTDQRPQYHIDEKSHSIGLRWEGWDNEEGRKQYDKDGKPIVNDKGAVQMRGHYGHLEKMFIPRLMTETSADGKTKNASEQQLQPQCMLNLFELPGLLFYQYLMSKYKKSQFDAEKLIKQAYNHLQSFFKEVADGSLKPVEGKDNDDRKQKLEQVLEEKYHLMPSDIPDKLKNYLLSKEIDYDKKLEDSAFSRLDEKKARVEKALSTFLEKKKRIGSKDNKFDKMRATIKTGQLAQWLIRDITEWLPNNSVSLKKLTGQKYVVLQSSLAMLGQRIDDSETTPVGIADIKQFFREALVIADKVEEHDSQCHHPFLHEVIDECEMNCSVEAFYELYLNKELDYIKEIKKVFKTNSSDNYLLIPFLHFERSRWKEPTGDSVRKLAESYLKRPLQLPNGMFTTPIFNLLMEVENPQLREALENSRKSFRTGEKEDRLSNNVSYLIRLYWEFVEQDHSQPFYNTTPTEGRPSPYRHMYRVFKTLYGEKIPHTNRTIFPAYTIEEIRVLRKKALDDINVYVEHEIQEWEDKQQFKFEQKFKKKFKKENDKRYQKHEKRLNVDKEVEKAVQLEMDTIRKESTHKRKESTHKLEKQLKKVYDNERDIRRYRTQDILLLIMAREILKAKSNDKDFTEGFCLKNVMTESLLDKRVDFSWDVLIRDKGKGFARKSIEQKNMKMKNYGQFYKFASDHQRLESLLSRLPQSVFQRAEIENEFSYYDTNRSEVFRQVYIIESEAYKLRPELQDDSNAKEVGFFYTDGKTGKPRPIRNSFLKLLEILAAGEDGVLDDSEKKSMQETRNAFSHNTYDVDLPVVFEGRESHMKIPEIAEGIKDKIEKQTDELKREKRKAFH